MSVNKVSSKQPLVSRLISPTRCSTINVKLPRCAWDLNRIIRNQSIILRLSWSSFIGIGLIRSKMPSVVVRQLHARNTYARDNALFDPSMNGRTVVDVFVDKDYGNRYILQAFAKKNDRSTDSSTWTNRNL